MIRLILFLVIVAALVAGGVWMADNPGLVTVQWLGWRLDSSVPILLLAVFLLLILVGVVLRVLSRLLGLPAIFGKMLRGRRSRKGLAALGRAMTALVVGDSYGARKATDEAVSLLGALEVADLLKARAALLDTDPTAALALNTGLTGSKATALAGLRGLMEAAEAAGDDEKLIEHATKALEKDKNCFWALRTLAGAQRRLKRWGDLLNTLERARKNGALPTAEIARSTAAILCQMCDDALKSGEVYEAVRLARRAADANPAFLPAAVRLVRALKAEGATRKALAAAETAWGNIPHPALARAFFEVIAEEEPLARVSQAEKLAGANPEHPESRYLVAEAALDAALWGQARSRLKPLVESGVQEKRLAVLMARLEEAEHGNQGEALRWLKQAVALESVAVWVCGVCGHGQERWTAECPACKTLGSITGTRKQELVPV